MGTRTRPSSAPERAGFRAVLWLVLVGGLLSPGVTAPARESVSPDRSVTIGEAGPWGTLEYCELRIEPPTWYAQSAVEAELRKVTWRFPGFGIRNLGPALAAAGLDGDQVSRLLDGSPVTEGAGGVEIVPPEDLLRSLSPEVRGRVYELLKHDPVEFTYRLPYVLHPGWYEELRTGGEIRSDLVELVQGLTYPRGKVSCFSDMPLALRAAGTRDEQVRLMKVVLRERGLGAWVRLEGTGDFATLREYWSADGRNGSILPLLDAVHAAGADERIDLVHLLPPVPRSLLYTFTNAEMAPGVERPDCFWTAANFFNLDISNRFLDGGTVKRFLTERFSEIEGTPQFGDVVLIVDGDAQRPIHACNYLADGLVYTKNGRSINRPWVIDHLSRVVEGYRNSGPVSLHFYRQRDQSRRGS